MAQYYRVAHALDTTYISYYIPVGLRPFDVMIEQKVLMVVFLRKQMDYVGLQLILDLDMQPR